MDQPMQRILNVADAHQRAWLDITVGAAMHDMCANDRASSTLLMQIRRRSKTSQCINGLSKQ
jgi:hypothetical protein